MKPERSTQGRFDEWMETDDGRAVYESIRLRALGMRGKGWRHFGIRCLWEIARYDRSLQVGPDHGFKMNNNHHSRMARLLMEREPGLVGFFETRELRS